VTTAAGAASMMFWGSGSLIFQINRLRLARYEAHAPRPVPDFDIKAVRVLIGVH